MNEEPLVKYKNIEGLKNNWSALHARGISRYDLLCYINDNNDFINKIKNTPITNISHIQAIIRNYNKVNYSGFDYLYTINFRTNCMDAYCLVTKGDIILNGTIDDLKYYVKHKREIIAQQKELRIQNMLNNNQEKILLIKNHIRSLLTNE